MVDRGCAWEGVCVDWVVPTSSSLMSILANSERTHPRLTRMHVRMELQRHLHTNKPSPAKFLLWALQHLFEMSIFYEAKNEAHFRTNWSCKHQQRGESTKLYRAHKVQLDWTTFRLVGCSSYYIFHFRNDLYVSWEKAALAHGQSKIEDQRKKNALANRRNSAHADSKVS